MKIVAEKYSGVDLYPLLELILMNAKLISDSKLPEGDSSFLSDTKK